MKVKCFIFILISIGMHQTSFAQKEITGKVTDAFNGKIMSGVHVYLSESTAGTITNKQGNYKIQGTEKDSLKFVYPNYETQTIAIGQQKIINVHLDMPSIYTIDTVLTFDPESYEEQIQVVRSEVNPRSQKVIQSQGIQYSNPVINKVDNPQLTDTESYSTIVENSDKFVLQNPLSTFGIDVDHAAYSNVRRFINQKTKPPKDAVRVEEMINYFDYDYPQPKGNDPFSVTTEIGDCPWNKERKLLHIGLQGKEIDYYLLPPSNLVFLLDVSGSMKSENKLTLVKKAFQLLVENLREEDQVSIVVYAGAAGVVLPVTAGSEKETILAAIQQLEAGGSTAGGAGIQLAYKIAKEHFLPDGNNRVIIATDGDFNVGVYNNSDLLTMIESKRKDQIFLTTLGFGMENYKDDKLELLADKGNGNYAYIDNFAEAKKVFMQDLRSNLFTIAKDVKIQIEFNPYYVESYRLVGYENRLLNQEDFADDNKDAGEIGVGHSVTALYEIVLQKDKKDFVSPTAIPLRYQEQRLSKSARKNKELGTIQLRYKQPKSEQSQLITKTVKAKILKQRKASDNFRFSAAVASLGLQLRESTFNQSLDFSGIQALAASALGRDENGYRKDFLELVVQSERLVLEK